MTGTHMTFDEVSKSLLIRETRTADIAASAVIYADSLEVAIFPPKIGSRVSPDVATEAAQATLDVTSRANAMAASVKAWGGETAAERAGTLRAQAEVSADRYHAAEVEERPLTAQLDAWLEGTDEDLGIERYRCALPARLNRGGRYHTGYLTRVGQSIQVRDSSRSPRSQYALVTEHALGEGFQLKVGNRYVDWREVVGT